MLLVEVFALHAVVTARRYLSTRWTQKLSGIANGNNPFALAIFGVLSLPYLDRVMKVSKLDRQIHRQDAVDHIVRPQYNADKAFAQRAVHISGFVLLFAILLWFLLGTNDSAIDV